MSEQLGSMLGILKAIGPFVLLFALAYGVMNWRRRSRSKDQAGEQAAHRLYTDKRAQHDNLAGESAGRPTRDR